VITQAKKDPWVFKGILDGVGEAGVPQELNNVILCMLKRVQTVKKEARMHTLYRSASFVSH